MKHSLFTNECAEKLFQNVVTSKLYIYKFTVISTVFYVVQAVPNTKWCKLICVKYIYIFSRWICSLNRNWTLCIAFQEKYLFFVFLNKIGCDARARMTWHRFSPFWLLKKWFLKKHKNVFQLWWPRCNNFGRFRVKRI